MATRETPRGVEATGFADNKLIENCPLVITTIECRPKDKKTYEFDYKIAGNPHDKDALFLKDIRESTTKEEGSGFFSCGGTTYKVYEGTAVDNLGTVIDEIADQRGASHCILYAHGLGSDPENTIKTAGQMNDYFSKGDEGKRAFVVPICWPAEEKKVTCREGPMAFVHSYVGQKEDAAGAATAMRSVLQSLNEAKANRKRPLHTKIAMMAHSMGNFVLKRFAPEGSDFKPDDFKFCACFMVAADVRSSTFSECPEAYVPKEAAIKDGLVKESDKPPLDDEGKIIKDEKGHVKNFDHDGVDICRVVDGKIHIVHHSGDLALLGRRFPMFGNTGKNDFWLGRRALGKNGPDFKGKPLDCDECLHPKTSEEPYVSGHLVDESSLHPDCQGRKLVWTDGKYFHNEFGFGRDPLGHSYQYGKEICNYYLGALGLPKPSDQVSAPKK